MGCYRKGSQSSGEIPLESNARLIHTMRFSSISIKSSPNFFKKNFSDGLCVFSHGGLPGRRQSGSECKWPRCYPAFGLQYLFRLIQAGGLCIPSSG